MASSGNSRQSSARKNNSNNRSRSNTKAKNARYDEPEINPDIVVLLAALVGIFLFLCNFHIIGSFGEIISKGMFGLFGVLAYIVPLLLIAVVFFGYLARESTRIKIKLIACIILYSLISIMTEEIWGTVRDLSTYSIRDIWMNSSDKRAGGGVIFGSIAYMMDTYLNMTGTMIVLLILIFLCILVLMGRAMIGRIKANGREAIQTARVDARNRREERREVSRYEDDSEVFEEDIPRYAKKRRGIGVGIGSEPVKDDYQGEELTDIDRTPRRDKKVSGVMADTSLKQTSSKNSYRDDMHEITVKDSDEDMVVEKAYARADNPFDEVAAPRYGRPAPVEVAVNDSPASFEELHAYVEPESEVEPVYEPVLEPVNEQEFVSLEGFEDVTFNTAGADTQTDAYDEPVSNVRPKATVNKDLQGLDPITKDTFKTMTKSAKKVNKKYRMPDVSLLNKPSVSTSGNSKEELMRTAKTLQDTLETFGVNAKVTDISQGPAVTRFELQPEVGVRVNKIVSLSDDLKLSLAATDIRIEAPIPGKSAVGIEVPNKESSMVGFRELLEDKAFKNFDSKIAFAVGKDIAGNVVVTDIAKMPHMLIAGATGSGKSVCINTIIMSILYKAHPDDVKLIMIDPKVVELSVYNGIPHLMVPVVTDPKKASAALHWAVAEMTKRFQTFADFKVRDLKGYNKAVESLPPSNDPDAPKKMPQIVIIVDELADLMMVAAKEVEESICRLAQLARACGIHLIIATQRPSVDVITGLIKANMPSRVAFAVSSGVDSRTILDMNGAEKLLGKGDMLFYPQGYPKPARVQGAFISDSEVSNVVNFLKDQEYGVDDQSDLLTKMNNIAAGGGATSISGDDSDSKDELFAAAGMFIIEQGKASIGSLQRKFKIGFNRAARIMDQLSEAGVVGPEEGTKPRAILMGPEQFEQYIDDYV